MSLEIYSALKKPTYAVAALAITTLFATTFLRFDNFLFFAPYLILYLPQSGFGVMALDLSISILSGVTIALSIYQIRNVLTRGKNQGKIGLTGIMVALLSGACPCYYLVPLLAVAGSAGGALAAFGIFFSTYQLPIKLLSLTLLASVVYSLERSFKASCSIRRGQAMIGRTSMNG